MEVEEALKLKRRDRVYINYRGTPGHGSHITGVGIVEITPTRISSHMGTKYVGVVVRPKGHAQHASVYPSHCLTLIK